MTFWSQWIIWLEMPLTGSISRIYHFTPTVDNGKLGFVFHFVRNLVLYFSLFRVKRPLKRSLASSVLVDKSIFCSLETKRACKLCIKKKLHVFAQKWTLFLLFYNILKYRVGSCHLINNTSCVVVPRFPNSYKLRLLPL